MRPPDRPLPSRTHLRAQETERRHRKSLDTLVASASTLWRARAAVLAARRVLRETA